jgi:hypothetical protein
MLRSRRPGLAVLGALVAVGAIVAIAVAASAVGFIAWNLLS